MKAVWQIRVQLELLCVDVADDHSENIGDDNDQIQGEKSCVKSVNKKPWQENSSDIESSKEEKEKPDETTALPPFPPAKIQDQREHVDDNDDTDLDEEETKWIRLNVGSWGNSSIPEGRFSKWF